MDAVNFVPFLGVAHLDDQMIQDVRKILAASPVPVAGPGGVGEPVIAHDAVILNGLAANNDNSQWDFNPVMDDEVDHDFQGKDFALPALTILLRFQAYFGQRDELMYPPDGEDDFFHQEKQITAEHYPELFEFYESLFGPWSAKSVDYDGSEEDEDDGGFNFDAYHGDESERRDQERKALDDANIDIIELIKSAEDNIKVQHALDDRGPRLTAEEIERIVIFVRDHLDEQDAARLAPVPYVNDPRKSYFISIAGLQTSRGLATALCTDPRLDYLVEAGSPDFVDIIAGRIVDGLNAAASKRRYRATMNLFARGGSTNPYHKHECTSLVSCLNDHLRPQAVAADVNALTPELRQRFVNELTTTLLRDHREHRPYFRNLRSDNERIGKAVLGLLDVDLDALIAQEEAQWAEREKHFREEMGHRFGPHGFGCFDDERSMRVQPQSVAPEEEQQPMRYVLSLMRESGNREDWQPLTSLVVTLPVGADISVFEKQALTEMTQQLGVTADYGEYYLWSTPLLAEVTTPKETALALQAERKWSGEVPSNLSKPRDTPQDYRKRYESAWSKLTDQVRTRLDEEQPSS